MQYVLYDDGGFPPEFCRSEMQARMTTRNGLSKTNGSSRGEDPLQKSSLYGDCGGPPACTSATGSAGSKNVHRGSQGAPRVRAPPGRRRGRPAEVHPAARASRSACSPQRVQRPHRAHRWAGFLTLGAPRRSWRQPNGLHRGRRGRSPCATRRGIPRSCGSTL